MTAGEFVHKYGGYFLYVLCLAIANAIFLWAFIILALCVCVCVFYCGVFDGL